jgi:hypothetical protein
VQELQASTDPSSRALAVRVTDGLAKATVMQWRRQGPGDNHAPDGTRVAVAGGLMILISGDVPDDVKEQLLRAFVRAAKVDRSEIGEGSWARDQEPEGGLEMLSLDRDSLAVARFFLAIPEFVEI